MKIGILQTGHTPDQLHGTYGDYNNFFVDLLAGVDATFESYAVVDGVRPDGPAAADAWLITGSKFGAYEPHAWIGPLEELIRAIYARGLPMVGICFGHQIIAQALGGRVEKYRDGWSVGPVEYQRHDLDRSQTLIAWHQDQVVKLPPDAEVIGSSPFCSYAMLRYGDRALTYQAHPEFTSDFFCGLVDARGDVLLADMRKSAGACTETPLDRADIANEIKEFLTRSHQRVVGSGSA